MKMCSVDGCPKRLRLRGLCGAHWYRLKTTGDVQADKPLRPYVSSRNGMKARILAWIEEDGSGCWIWRGGTNGRYGTMTVEARPVLVHRIMLQEKIGQPIPDGMLACHACDVPLCVNPDHLFLATPKQNTQDMVAKGRGANHLGPYGAGRIERALEVS